MEHIRKLLDRLFGNTKKPAPRVKKPLTKMEIMNHLRKERLKREALEKGSKK